MEEDALILCVVVCLEGELSVVYGEFFGGGAGANPYIAVGAYAHVFGAAAVEEVDASVCVAVVCVGLKYEWPGALKVASVYLEVAAVYVQPGGGVGSAYAYVPIVLYDE